MVEKHAPLNLRGRKERTDVSGKGNLGTVFAKIIRRTGFVRWKKLIHNLRASFETDLLNGEYGQYGLHTIAGWLGHSVKVMLEHYGRIRKSDFDQIEQACLKIKQKKEQTKSAGEAHLVPFLVQNEGFAVEDTGLNPPPRVAQNAAQYTAVQGGNKQNSTEISSHGVSTQPLTNIAVRGKKWKDGAPCGNPRIPQIGGGGNRTRVPIPIRISVYVCIRFFDV